MKTVVPIALALGLAVPAAHAQDCTYLAMGGCFLSRNAAHDRAEEVGGRVEDADDIVGARPGFFCVVRGPYTSRRAAERAVAGYRLDGVADAYVKSVCDR